MNADICSTAKPAVSWILSEPTAYHQHFLRALHDSGEVDLRVFFMQDRWEFHPWRSNLTVGFDSTVYRRGLMNIDWSVVRAAAATPESLWLVAGWNDRTANAVVLIRALRGFPYVLWSDTPTRRRRSWGTALLRSAFLRLAFSRARYVLGTGALSQERLDEIAPVGPKFRNFPFFVDLNQYRPLTAISKPEQHEIVFLSAGRLVNNLKGFDIALKALAFARDSVANPRIGIKYRIAGTGPDEVNLQRLAASLGLDVEFVGWLDPDQMPAFYNSGHVLLHPALVDPYPNTILEAMACGLAVLGSDASGSAVDRIVDGESGLIHPAGSVEVLAGHITQVLQNPELLRRFGRAARRVSEQWPVGRGVGLISALAGVTAAQARPRAGSVLSSPQ